MDSTLYNPNLADVSGWEAGRRVLALDVGKKRIGLAVSDELGITAQGLETLERTNIRQDLARLTQLIAEKSVSLILMGNPLHMSGREGRQGRGGRTHLVSPAVAAATAVTGYLTAPADL